MIEFVITIPLVIIYNNISNNRIYKAP